EKSLPERPLVRPDRVPPDRLHVLDGRHEAGEELVRLRARLESVAERLVRRGAHLVRPPGLEQLAARERDAEVRAEELVRRADEDVDAERLDVDRPVRPEVDRSEEHTSELQSQSNLVCRLLLEKKKKVRPNHETNINIIARRKGKDVNIHTVLDGIINNIIATIQRINIIGSREGSRKRRRLKENQTGKKFRVGIKSNISTNRNNLISVVDRFIHFFFNDTATTEIYTLSLHDALPI